jgi:DNA-binding transcriptional regulator/RsmH inhibitor MraZ
VGIDVREIDADKRITIPRAFMADLPWLRPSMPCLLVLKEPGRLLVRNWSEHEELLRTRRRELVEDAEGGDPEAEERLVLFDDQYRRIRLDVNGRVPLAGIPLVHLLGDVREGRAVFLVKFTDRLELWSMRHRNARRRRGGIGDEEP